MKSYIALLLLCLFAATACDTESEGVLGIDATGVLNGFVYVDRDADGELEIFDAPAPNVTVSLLTPGSSDVIANATTNEGGIFEFVDIPVGRYSVQVLPESLGDSLQFASVDSAVLTVAANDTATAIIAIGYHQITIADLAAVEEGRRVLVQAVALHALNAFGDSTLHIADSTGVARALLVNPAPIQAGDTLRLLGTVTVTAYDTTIAGVTAFILGSGALTRQPVALSTAAAGTADDGALAFDLVRIDSATVINTQAQPGGELHVNVDDGSGVLTVVLDPSGQFGNQPNLIAGALFDATGLLVPTEAGTTWILKPRNAQDISARFQRVTVAQARALTPGRLVQIEGLALNSYVAFGDQTVHIVDATGSLRGVNVGASTLVQGDSVRFVGRIDVREAQPVISSVTPTVLAQNRLLPPPVLLTSAAASSAGGGVHDAALVRVENATITDAAILGGAFIVGINDGSGRLELRVPQSIAQAQFVVGHDISVTGLLVPVTGGGTWQLRPRAQSDLTITAP